MLSSFKRVLMDSKFKANVALWVNPILLCIIGFLLKQEIVSLKNQIALIPGMATKLEILSLRTDIAQDELKNLKLELRDHLRQPMKHEDGDVKPQNQ